MHTQRHFFQSVLFVSLIGLGSAAQANLLDQTSTPDTTATAAAVQVSTENFSPVVTAFVPRFAPQSQIDAARSKHRQLMSAAQTMQTAQLAETVDVGEIDRMLSYLLERAGHYPPRFSDRAERQIAAAEVRQLLHTIDQHVIHPNASFELLIRAVKLNQVGRNLDLGVSTAIKAGVYMRRAIALQPDDPAANYWYGTMLVEGGGIKEGMPYLNKAISLGEKKAYLVLAQAYLHLEQREFALKALQRYDEADPSQQAWTANVTARVRNGKSLIWSD